MGRADPADPYAVLGLDRAATDAEIRRAFRRLARLAHPDAGGDPARFVALRRAHDLLTDPVARARFDAEQVREDAATQTPTRRQTPPASLAAVAAGLRQRWPALEVAWQGAAEVLVPFDGGAGLVVVGRGHLGSTVGGGPPRTDDDGPGVAAVRATDGVRHWRAGLVAVAVGAPAVLADLVMVVTADGLVHGLDAATGATRWERRLAADPMASVAHGDVVVVASSDALTAVGASGEVAWVVRPHGGVTDLAVGGPVVVVRSGSGAVIGIDPRTGATRWWLRVGTRWDYPPVVAGGWLWLPETGPDDGPGNRLVGVDPRSGSAAHTLGCPAPVRSLHAVGGLLIVRDHERGLTAVRNGRPLWRMVVPSPVSTPAATPDAVVVATGDGALRFLSARHGDEVHQVAIDLPSGPPGSLAVLDDVVVVGGGSRGGGSGGIWVHRVVTPVGGPSPR